VKIQFCGATDEVTGSMTLLEIDGRCGLIDCGLYQGDAGTAEKNFLPIPFDPRVLESVVVTHAHLDHSGKLPYLVKKGFKGAIFCTPETYELVKIILSDSASLNESKDDALYNEEDVKNTIKLIRTVKWEQPFDFLGETAKLFPAGHILGASSLLVEGDKTIVFSGDLGRNNDLLIPPPPPCPATDVVVMESTYGDRVRKGDAINDMMTFLTKVRKGNTVGIIASFALARGQTLITLIAEIFKVHPELKVPLYFDSPMMKEVNAVYKKHSEITNLPWEMFFALEHADSVDYPREWETLKRKTGPFIVISSSGMVTGGRIFRSLSNWQNDPEAILFLVGYQGENTPGRALLQGERMIKDNEGNDIIWQGEIFSSEAFSSHADQPELLTWAKSSGAKRIFLIHGEKHSKESLKSKLGLEVTKDILIPIMNEIYHL